MNLAPSPCFLAIRRHLPPDAQVGPDNPLFARGDFTSFMLYGTPMLVSLESISVWGVASSSMMYKSAQRTIGEAQRLERQARGGSGTRCFSWRCGCSAAQGVRKEDLRRGTIVWAIQGGSRGWRGRGRTGRRWIFLCVRGKPMRKRAGGMMALPRGIADGGTSRR